MPPLGGIFTTNRGNMTTKIATLKTAQYSPYPRTAEAYERTIYFDTVFALTGRPGDITKSDAAHKKELLAWGLKEFPTFVLSPTRMKNALIFATALRETLELARLRNKSAH